MKTIFYFLLFCTSFLHAQIKGDTYNFGGDGRSLTKDQLEKAKILYKKYFTSEDYIEEDKLMEKLSSIANEKSHLQEFVAYEENIDAQKIQNWVTKNIPAEKNDEATKLLSRIVTLKNKIDADNAEIIDILKYKASFEQWQDISKSVNP